MKKSRLLIIILFLSVYSISSGQERIFKFAHTGSNANIQVTKSDSLGFTYIAGTFNSVFTFQDATLTNPDGETSTNLFVMKILPNGRLAYLHQIKDADGKGYLELKNVAVNDRGEAVMLINAYQVSTFQIANRKVPLSTKEFMQVIVKISKTGYIKWIRVIRALGGNDDINGQDMEIDEEGNVFVTGYFEADEAVFGTKVLPGLATYPQMFLAKYTLDGEVDWVASCKVEATGDTIGGITAQTLRLSDDNKVYVAGELTGSRDFNFNNTIVSNQGTKNAYLACYHITGDVNWIRGFVGDGEISSGDFNFDGDNNVVYTCFYKSDVFKLETLNLSNPNDFDLAIVKYTPNGETIWEKNHVTDLSFLRTFENDVHVFAGDSSDITLWGNYIQGGVNHFYSMQMDNKTGAFEWFNSSTNTSAVYVDQIVSDSRNNLYFLGSAYSGFEYGNNTVTDATGYGVNYLGKVGDDGQIKFFSQIKNDINSSVSFQSIGTDKYGNLIVLGSFSGDSAKVGTHSLVSNTRNYGMFVAKNAGSAKIAGKVVNFSGAPITNGYIKLLGYAYNQKCIVSDSVPIRNDGNYVFMDVPLGSYIMHAFPGTTNRVDYHPVYFPSNAHWEDAAKIRVSDLVEYSNMYIFTPEVVEQTGNSTITGFVQVVDETDLFKSTMKKPRASSKASLARIATKSEYVIIAITETDEYGNFYFENVSDGDYFVLIEEAGLPNSSVHMVTVVGNMYVSNVNYLVTEEEVEAVDTPETDINDLDNISGLSKVLLYPNPSDGVLTLKAVGEGSINSVKVTTLDGREVYSLSGMNLPYLQIELVAGIYLVQINSFDGIETHKVIVQ